MFTFSIYLFSRNWKNGADAMQRGFLELLTLSGKQYISKMTKHRLNVSLKVVPKVFQIQNCGN